MKIIKFIKKYKLEIAVFSFFLFLSTPFITEICSGYLRFAQMDLQEFLLWNYSSTNGILPYRDLFYPYGIANYFRNVNLLSEFIYFMLSPAVFTCLFMIFKKVYKSELFSFLAVLSLYLFILFIVGFDTFTRYGVFVAYSLIVVYSLFQNKNVTHIRLLSLSILSGIIFSFFNDIGAYTVVILTLSYGLFSIAQRKSILYAAKRVVVLFTGFVIGLLPFVVFLFNINSLSGFFTYFNEVKNIAEVAKTPFFSFITSPSNLFTVVILFFSVFYLLYKQILTKEKLSLLSAIQLILVFDILLLEQKSIIRSIDLQISFVSFILLGTIVFEMIKAFKIKNKYFIYLIILFSVFFMFGSISGAFWTSKYLNFNKSINSSLNSTCFEDNLKVVKSKNPSLDKLFTFLTKERDFNGKIFSFPPGSAAIYTIFNNKPPFYNAIFESSSIESQNQSIEFIKKNDIAYIVLDTSPYTVQDGVPDFIRAPIEFKFIINNYYPLKTIGSYTILKKSRNKDLFESSLLKNTQYEKYLLNVNLYAIPYSEGLYKINVLSDKKYMDFSDLKNTDFSSKYKVLVLEPENSLMPNDLINVSIETTDSKKTIISLNPCKRAGVCVINLSNIPLFYKDRFITSIEVDKKFKGSIKVFEVKNKGNLW